MKAASSSSLISQLPVGVQSYLQPAFGQLHNLYLQLPKSAREYLAIASHGYSSTFGLGIASVAFVVIAVSMSRWGSWTDRLSPFGSRGAPEVTENDYSYITSADLEEPERAYNPTSHRSPPTMSAPEEDVLLIKHGKVTYPIKFPAYSIGDGKLQVRDVKERAAETIPGVSKASRLRLVYKGQQLKQDSAICCDYGMRNHSEILCLVSDGPGGSDSEDASDDGSVIDSSGGTKKKRSRKSKKKGKKSSKESILTPSEEPSPRARSPAPGPVKPQTPIEKLQTIQSHFSTKILPLCVQFTAKPPSDPKKKEYEHKKLSETIMNEVLLKLDAVETEGNPEARQMRKDLVKQTQEVLNGLDARAAA